MRNNGVFTITSVNCTAVKDAPTVASTSNYVIAFPCIDVTFPITKVPGAENYAYPTVVASTSNYVIALPSIDVTTQEKYAKPTAASTRDYVVTIASNYVANPAVNSIAFFGNASDYIITTTSINGSIPLFN
jgi:hypothetical protein